MIDAKQNEVPVFVNQTPALILFSQDNWEFPIMFYDVKKSEEFIKILDKRKTLVFKGGNDANLDDMENLNAYLDQVIAQNDEAIK